MLRAAVLAGLALALHSCVAMPAMASPLVPTWVARFKLASCGNPCVIRENDGGYVPDFEHATRQIKARGRRLVIDGPCRSACTLMADQARPNVCVTERASLHFHQGFSWTDPTRPQSEATRSPLRYSPDIAAWIADKGGQPLHGWLDMSAEEARRFFPACEAPDAR